MRIATLLLIISLTACSVAAAPVVDGKWKCSLPADACAVLQHNFEYMDKRIGALENATHLNHSSEIPNSATKLK